MSVTNENMKRSEDYGTYTLNDTLIGGATAESQLSIRMDQPGHGRWGDEEGRRALASENGRLKVHVQHVAQYTRSQHYPPRELLVLAMGDEVSGCG